VTTEDTSLTVADVAERYAVAATTVHAWLRRGLLPGASIRPTRTTVRSIA
jgi:predicted site-specific integrase-resolvase